MRIILLTLVISDSVFLAACQKDKRANHAPVPAQDTVGPLDRVSVQNTPLTCANLIDCPEAVGQLIAYDQEQPYICTVSLVSSRVVLTASHCVPWKQVDRRERTIRGECYVRFPQVNNRAAQEVACHSVIKASRVRSQLEGTIEPDYAYIELEEPVRRRPLKSLAGKGRRPDRNSSALVYGVQLRRNAHTIVGQECMREDSRELPNRKVGRSGAIILPNCPIEIGFSGGPILQPQSHRLLGVLSFMKFAQNGEAPVAVGTKPPRLEGF